MLCEQCQNREATVQFSTLAWPSGSETKHLCESCCPSAEWTSTISAAEPVMAKIKPLTRRMTLRTRLGRKYGRHLFASALDLAARSIIASRIPVRSIRGKVRRGLIAMQLAIHFLVLRRLSWIMGLQSEVTFLLREAKRPSSTFRTHRTKA